MPLEPFPRDAFALVAQVEAICARLLRIAHPEPHLGGKLLYAGALDEPGRAFTLAASIAGAATLAASPDPAAARQAMRDGVVDFLVNSLDEALRILKNQVRKRETVAVCVSLAPAAVEDEMCVRGVVPDLSFPPDFPGARMQKEVPPHPPAEPEGYAAPIRDSGGDQETWLTWRTADSPAQWLPKLDTLALECLPAGEAFARRWLERAPRTLGRLAQNLRALRTRPAIADQIVARFRSAVSSGAIPVAVEITLGPWDEAHVESLVPSP